MVKWKKLCNDYYNSHPTNQSTHSGPPSSTNQLNSSRKLADSHRWNRTQNFSPFSPRQISTKMYRQTQSPLQFQPTDQLNCPPHFYLQNDTNIIANQPVTPKKFIISTPPLSINNLPNNNILSSQTLSLTLSHQPQSTFDCQSATKLSTKYLISPLNSLLFNRRTVAKLLHSTLPQTIPEWL